ncbi:protein of unknown function [Candidatus Hydrogenisulfobacillus filiaventi]|uniref:N-acetyltransferase domain-containing protein n=1 Tax=Candidatus Hydrogenisulfobacillus filiaventi TaxID=2707344 RepID=A0A6F8ZCM2_9FIRM|nr:GNAT family N-acetyltransferase [Bacillota bacterium]CAB1127681.1 protein of unknown function [Candidatus Hydrogenisulfobacillus filiaventi]
MIRFAMPTDARPLAEMVGEQMKGPKVSRTRMAAMLEEAIVHDLGLVAESDSGELQGYILYRVSADLYTERHRGFIRHLCVARPWRGQGIGSLLLEAAEQELGSNTAEVYALVPEDNPALARFLARHGYRPMELSVYAGWSRAAGKALYVKTMSGWLAEAAVPEAASRVISFSPGQPSL